MSRQHHHDKWRVFLNKLSKKAGNVTQKSPETAKSDDRYRQQASKKVPEEIQEARNHCIRKKISSEEKPLTFLET